MRDKPTGWPEILDAYEREGHYFGVVQIERNGTLFAFEFGVDQKVYRALRRVLQTRPFQNTAVAPYRYFYMGFVYRPEHKLYNFRVRIQQGRDVKQFVFTGPQSLVGNLMWFDQLTDLTAASHLKQVSRKA